MLRRLRSEVGASVNPPGVPTVEVSLPLDLSREQRQCYRAVLARFYEVLADPRPPRHAGHRAAQMRTVCGELRKVGPAPLCAHLAWPVSRMACEPRVQSGTRATGRRVPCMTRCSSARHCCF